MASLPCQRLAGVPLHSSLARPVSHTPTRLPGSHRRTPRTRAEAQSLVTPWAGHEARRGLLKQAAEGEGH